MFARRKVDDPNLVANAGLLLVATMSQRLGLEELIDATVRLDWRVVGARPGRKVLALAHALCAESSHIDHTDMLRAGATASVLGHRVMVINGTTHRSGRSCGPSRSGIAGRWKP